MAPDGEHEGATSGSRLSYLGAAVWTSGSVALFRDHSPARNRAVPRYRGDAGDRCSCGQGWRASKRCNLREDILPAEVRGRPILGGQTDGAVIHLKNTDRLAPQIYCRRIPACANLRAGPNL